MRARISGGIAGWLIGVVPLIVVNILDYQDLLALQDAVPAGLIALIGGILLGGIVAGLLGGRSGGAFSATISGAIAAVLYAGTLIGLVLGAGVLDSISPLIAQYPLPISMALLFLAAILLAISIATGTLSGRRTNSARAPSPAYHSTPLTYSSPQPPYGARAVRSPSQPQNRQRDAAYADYRTPRDAGYGPGYSAGTSRPLPPDASDPRYATSRSRPANSTGLRRDERPPEHNADWRQSGR